MGDIDRWIEGLVRRGVERTGLDVSSFVEDSLGRFVRTESRKIGGFDAARYPASDVDHVIDWLAASVVRRDDWLARKDEYGRPKKLMKFGSLPQMVAEANKAMRKRRNDGVGLAASADADLVHDCGDGWGVFRLTSRYALIREGNQMGHCVGQGAYDHAVQGDNTAIYSLRDRFGKSHATVEVNLRLGQVRQIKGKENGFPKPAYLKRLIPWFDKTWTFSEIRLPDAYAIDRSGRMVHLPSLEPGSAFDGDLHFENFYAEEDLFIVPLPEGTTINGELKVRGPNVLERLRAGKGDDRGVLQQVVLPKDLKVSGVLKLVFLRLDTDRIDAGTLHLRQCEVIRIPERVEAEKCVFSKVSFEDTNGTVFAGDVEIRDAFGTRFSPGVEFEKDVFVRDSHVNDASNRPAVVFGDGIRFGGALTVEFANVEIGESCGVKGDLNIGSGRLTLQDNIEIGGDLRIDDGVLNHWPGGLVVGGKMSARDLEVAGVELTKEDIAVLTGAPRNGNSVSAQVSMGRF